MHFGAHGVVVGGIRGALVQVSNSDTLVQAALVYV